MLADLFQKFGKRTFMGPASATGLAVFNDAAKLGLDWKVMALAVGASILWAFIETWRDTTMMKNGLWKKS